MSKVFRIIPVHPLPFLFFPSYIFLIGSCLGQGLSIEKIDTTLNYSTYWQESVPLMARACQTLSSMNFRVNRIYFNNELFVDNNDNEFADIRFDREKWSIWDEPFKRCILLHFRHKYLFDEFKARFLDDWRSFCTPIPVDGYILLPVIKMNDSTETKQCLSEFNSIFQTLPGSLPEAFFKPFNMFEFVYQATLEDLAVNEEQYFFPCFQRLIYRRTPEFVTFDTTSTVLRQSFESLTISGCSKNGYFFDLSFFMAGDDFLVTETPYPQKHKKVVILEVKNMKFRGHRGKRIKVRTTVQEPVSILGRSGLTTSPGVYSYDYITLLEIAELTIQITSNYPNPNPNNKTIDISYNKAEIELLLTKVLNFIEKK
jgi:hypothetical protein